MKTFRAYSGVKFALVEVVLQNCFSKFENCSQKKTGLLLNACLRVVFFRTLLRFPKQKKVHEASSVEKKTDAFAFKSRRKDKQTAELFVQCPSVKTLFFFWCKKKNAFSETLCLPTMISLAKTKNKLN